MDEATLMSLLAYFVMWILPAFAIMFYYYKTSKLNKIYIFLYIGLLFTLFMQVFYTFIQSNGSYLTYILNATSITYLISFYGFIGLSFIMYLMVDRKWDFPQAFAISVVSVGVGRFFWEAPTIIYNVLQKGFVIDIFLQLVGLLFVLFIYITCGWKSDRKTIIAVLSGVIISILFLYFRSPVPTENSSIIASYWNSPYFMINRFINILIVLYCVNKSKPMEKSK